MDEETLKHCDKMLQEDWALEYKYAGSFQTNLMRLIEGADPVNLFKIANVYPNITLAWRKHRGDFL